MPSLALHSAMPDEELQRQNAGAGHKNPATCTLIAIVWIVARISMGPRKLLRRRQKEPIIGIRSIGG